MYVFFRNDGAALGDIATRNDDIFECGGPDYLSRARVFAEDRFRKLEVQESSFARAGAEVPPGNVSTVKRAQREVTSKSKSLLPPPGPWAARQHLLSPGNITLRQCKSDELCRLASVSRPDVCARLARIASLANVLLRVDVFRIKDLAKTVQVRREDAAW